MNVIDGLFALIALIDRDCHGPEKVNCRRSTAEPPQPPSANAARPSPVSLKRKGPKTESLDVRSEDVTNEQHSAARLSLHCSREAGGDPRRTPPQIISVIKELYREKMSESSAEASRSEERVSLLFRGVW